MKKRVLLVVVLLAVGAAAAWSFNLPGRMGWRTQKPGGLTLYGNVDIRQVELGFRVAGRIKSMNFEEGDRVHAGTVLAQLNPQTYEDNVNMAAAKVAEQAAALEKLKAGPRAAEIAQARATLAERVADFNNAQDYYSRINKLRGTGAVAQVTIDKAQATRNMSEARVAAARQALRLLQEGSRPEDIAAARSGLRAAEASLATARTALADTRLASPAEGIILSRVKEPGAIVSPSDIVYVVSLIGPVWIRAYISEPQLGWIHPGMRVTVVSDSNPGHPYTGHIGFISPVAEFIPKTVQTPGLRDSLVYRFRVVVDQPGNGLRQGMPVTVRIAPPQHQGAG